MDFNLAWEIDFWGRFRRQIESASAELDASVANYDDAMVSLVAQVAQSYLVLRTFQSRLQIARENIVLQQESLRIAIPWFEHMTAGLCPCTNTRTHPQKNVPKHDNS